MLFQISGCLATAPVKHNIYFNPSDTFIVTGITDQFNLGFLKPMGPEHEKHNYEMEDKQVVWWAENTVQQSGWLNLPDICIQWVSPDGQLYKEEKKKPMMLYTTSSLPIKGELSPALQGEWKIRVFINQRLYEERNFIIGTVKGIDSSETAIPADAKEKMQIESHGAIGLFDNTSITIEEDGSYKIKYHARYKVLNERGKQLAEIFIPFNDKMEMYRIIKAYTITPTGKTVSADQARVVAAYAGYPSYTGNSFIEFALPAVNVGSVIEYEVEVISLFPMFKDNIGFNLLFPYFYPVLSSKIQVSFPNLGPNKPVRAKLYNVTENPATESIGGGKKTRYTWTLSNVPPITMEPAAPPYSEYIPELIVSDFQTWDGVAAWAKNTIASEKYADSDVEALVKNIIAGCKDQEESARKIFRYVQDNIRYVSVSLGALPGAPQSIRDILKSKYGDCKDCAVLLAAMLKVIGLHMDLVLVRTNDLGGLHLDTPFPYQFNHVVGVLDQGDKAVYLDPTAKYPGYGRLPDQDCSAFAMVFTEGEPEFKRLPAMSSEENERRTDNRMIVKDDLNVSGTFRVVAKGIVADGFRYRVKNMSTKERDTLAQETIRKYLGEADLQQHKFINLAETKSDFITELKYNMSDSVVSLGDLFAIAPLKGYHALFQDLKAKERVHDIVFTKLFSRHDRVVLDIPRDFKIKSLPKDFSIQTILGSASGEYQQKGNTVEILFKERLTRDRIKAEDYAEIQKYCEKINKAINQQIVFQRKTS